ncbi:YqjF family protein [Lentibacillus salicampi]|uniref:DUF2071 domain-containing protein n=1 Tax=Lentibacillus salicampi TaxID=175306 RepID=A0A4Y9AHD5_9BACI|nr:DUF2071 domain-containing protein [Lentibacillus salicampi]TFJ94370.1 DUF2071 domain-containing protein [Lentibacillus salicampi]
MYEDLLNSTAHRDRPLPPGPWVMMQQWEYLLFMHCRLSQQVVEQYLPPGLELDTYDGDAWVSVIPFKVRKLHLRGLPQMPFLNNFLEVNVRTYVKRHGMKGVYFFGLGTNQLGTVLGARLATLPYYYADTLMNIQDGVIHFRSERRGKYQGILNVDYQPDGEHYHPEKDSLESWLLDRFFLWTYKHGALYRGVIHHKQWEIQKAQAAMEQRLLTPFLPNGVSNGNAPAHYAASQTALIWRIQKEK